MSILPFIALSICLLLIALFAASEAALASTNRVRLRQLLRAQAAQSASDDNTSTSPAEQLSRDEQRFIATVTIAANVPLVAAAVLTIWMARDRFGSHIEASALCLATALFTVPFFQIVPRLLAARPGALGHLWWVRPARLIVGVLRPVVVLLLGVGTAILKPLGLLPAAPSVAADDSGLENADEIRDLVESAQAGGGMEENRELIESIFTFGDTRVHEVMIPRPDIVALPLEASFDQVLDTLQESGLSRIPLYEENVDQIVGIAHAKDVLKCLSRDSSAPPALRDLMREPLFVPESCKIDEALATMRAQRSHLSIVIDEYGGTAGLLTVEDILEELVGEIADEHDHKVEAPLVILDDDSALVDALLHVEDLESQWNLTLPSGEFDTVGGFVIEQLGRAPAVGDRVETANATLTVHAVRGRRPKKILIHRKPKEES